jgi:hypothetical protein
MALEFVKIGRFEMAKVRIIQGVVIRGIGPVEVGAVVDVTGSEYHFLKGAGRVVDYVDPVNPEDAAVVVPEKTGFAPYTKEVFESKKGRRK